MNNSDQIPSLNTDFSELRKLLLCHDMWYGDTTKTIVSNDIDFGENELDWFSVMMCFVRPGDKQLFLNIIVTGVDVTNHRGEFHDNYFFTWYDNRPFEVATLNGEPLTTETYDTLLKLLKMAHFKTDDKDLNSIRITSRLDEFYNISKKNN
jgi:hypothetical protein